MVHRREAIHGLLQLRMSLQRTPGHNRFFAGFSDQPEGSNVENPQGPNFFDFVPENQAWRAHKMNAQSADPARPREYFEKAQGVYHPADEETHQPKQMLPADHLTDQRSASE